MQKYKASDVGFNLNCLYKLFISTSKHSGHYMYQQVNIQQFYVLYTLLRPALVSGEHINMYRLICSFIKCRSK